jgi:hypothetical protein
MSENIPLTVQGEPQPKENHDGGFLSQRKLIQTSFLHQFAAKVLSFKQLFLKLQNSQLARDS